MQLDRVKSNLFREGDKFRWLDWIEVITETVDHAFKGNCLVDDVLFHLLEADYQTKVKKKYKKTTIQ